jgi:hypothetical protein
VSSRPDRHPRVCPEATANDRDIRLCSGRFLRRLASPTVAARRRAPGRQAALLIAFQRRTAIMGLRRSQRSEPREAVSPRKGSAGCDSAITRIRAVEGSGSALTAGHASLGDGPRADALFPLAWSVLRLPWLPSPDFGPIPISRVDDWPHHTAAQLRRDRWVSVHRRGVRKQLGGREQVNTPLHRSRTASSSASSDLRRRSVSGSRTSPTSRKPRLRSADRSAGTTSAVHIRRSAI